MRKNIRQQFEFIFKNPLYYILLKSSCLDLSGLLNNFPRTVTIKSLSNNYPGHILCLTDSLKLLMTLKLVPYTLICHIRSDKAGSDIKVIIIQVVHAALRLVSLQTQLKQGIDLLLIPVTQRGIMQKAASGGSHEFRHSTRTREPSRSTCNE